jgi:YesN/AraC family two-component response regulator
MKAISLLVVEDDDDTRPLVCRMIARRFPELNLLDADNGSAGVEVCLQHAPDIVITDISMPGMDGVAMVQEIKAIKEDTRFIAITAYSDSGRVNELSRIGIGEYIPKPIEFKLIFAAVNRYIDEIKACGAKNS